MLKVYALIMVLAILGGVGYAAKYYYDTTQATIATLRENNAKLEGAVETAEASIATLQNDMAKIAELNIGLQNDLKKAEEYGDNLRNKLRNMDLVGDALRDPEDLEGRMNGATAKLWRKMERDTGGAGDKPLPSWLQSVPARTGDQGSDAGTEDNSTASSTAEADTTD